jgi:hypothetical protein
LKMWLLNADHNYLAPLSLSQPPDMLGA